MPTATLRSSARRLSVSCSIVARTPASDDAKSARGPNRAPPVDGSRSISLRVCNHGRTSPDGSVKECRVRSSPASGSAAASRSDARSNRDENGTTTGAIEPGNVTSRRSTERLRAVVRGVAASSTLTLALLDLGPRNPAAQTSFDPITAPANPLEAFTTFQRPTFGDLDGPITNTTSVQIFDRRRSGVHSSPTLVAARVVSVSDPALSMDRSFRIAHPIDDLTIRRQEDCDTSGNDQRLRTRAEARHACVFDRKHSDARSRPGFDSEWVGQQTSRPPRDVTVHAEVVGGAETKGDRPARVSGSDASRGDTRAGTPIDLPGRPLFSISG